MFPQLRRALFPLAVVLLCGLCAPLGFAANNVAKLAPRYREWLQKDVVYIISNQEKQVFLQLTSDTERDQFIQDFWAIRNPNPGAPSNEFKEEHYRRIAYANQWFGHESGREGWRTDRGRVYITLGEPQQKAVYKGLGDVRPMEIWFYSRPHPALPPFFSVVFFQPDSGGEYKLYSPYMDGPEKLVTTINAQSGRVAALQDIDRAAGREVARTVLSLLPDEPVDRSTAQSSLASDVLLSTIRGLANHPVNLEMLQQRRSLMASVSHRIVLSSEFLDVSTTVLRHQDGEPRLHYLLRLNRPGDFALAQSSDHRYYYSIEVLARVMTRENKLIFTQQRKLSHFVDAAELAKIKNRKFAFAGWLPLAPGDYKLEFELLNTLGKTAFKASREVTVPALDQPLRISEVQPFETTAPAEGAGAGPFTVAGVKFDPLPNHDLTLVQGQPLKIMYQIWEPSAAGGNGAAENKLNVEYSYGRLNAAGETKTITDTVAANQFDPSGTLVNGKQIPTAELPPGNYRLMVSVSDPRLQKKTFSSLAFQLVNSGESDRLWTISDDEEQADVSDGTADHQRGLCYREHGDSSHAARWLAHAFQKHPDQRTLAELVDVYFAEKAFARVADLYRRMPVSRETEDRTILRAAESQDKLGDLAGSIQVLESALQLKPESGPLYVSLASYYRRSGDNAKASMLEQRGRALLDKGSREN